MSLTRSTRRGHRMLAIVTLALMLAGMVMPFAPASAFFPSESADVSQPNAANEQLVPLDSTETPTDGEQVPPDAVPTEDPNALPTEDPNALPTEDPNADPNREADPVADITLNVRWCPAGTVVGDPIESFQLQTDCTATGPQVNARLTSLNGVGGPFDGSATTFPGQIIWQDLPQESWSISVSPTTAATDEAMFCQGITPYGNTKPYQRYSLLSASYPMDTLPEESIECDWFGVLPGTPDAPMGQGDIEVYKYACNDAVPNDADLNWFMTNCTSGHDGVTFVLVGALQDGGDLQTDTGDSIPGAVRMGSVDADTYVLRELQVSGYSARAVFCATGEPQETPELTDYTPQTLNGSSIEATVTANMKLSCLWFNVEVPTGISLTIYKWDCPIGTQRNESEAYYSAECDMEMPGIPFDVTDANGTQQTTSDTNGRQIDNLVPDAAGQIIIKETIPAGYGIPEVYCRGLNDEEATRLVVIDATVNVQVPVPADDIQCFWYNIPDDESSTITIYKWECPEGLLYNQEHSYYSTQCDMQQPGVPFEVIDNNGSRQTTSDTNGREIDNIVPDASGHVTLVETVPAGFGDPAVFCINLADDTYVPGAQTGASYQLNAPTVVFDIQCYWYNIPESLNTVVVYKWQCPEGAMPENTRAWHETNCTQVHNSVEFTLTDSAGSSSRTTVSGAAQWNDVQPGAIQIAETVPSGYIPAQVGWCQASMIDGNQSVEFEFTAINGVFNHQQANGGWQITCHFYNYKVGPSDITVYKWMCPPGYDRTAYGADPYLDCTEAVNGIRFKLDQPDPEVDLFSDTGDSVPGAVYFGGLTPGTYTITEILEGEGIADTFVWECTGLNSSSVHPKPLTDDVSLNVTLVGGEHVICQWFNVPPAPLGWLDVTKFNCTTEKWVGDVYCYTNQTGQAFDLQMWNGSAWVTVASGTTNAAGTYSFHNLEPGEYRLVEPGKTACLTKSSVITADGNIGVSRGNGTTVHVYNCAVPYVPPKTPTKYPNTGTAPTAGEQQDMRLPMPELAALLTLAGINLNRRKLIAGLAALGVSGSAAAAQELVPMDATAPPATPGTTSEVCASPQVATPGVIDPDDSDTCGRGAIPVHIAIPDIGVDATIEYLEIIDGAMQAPSNEADVTWYKETTRLGDIGNGIYAGHLNYWGVPEGVFFRLESLVEGNAVELTGDDGTVYTYLVEWTRNFPSDEEPPAEALGATEEAAITLITCGGEWITDRSEYDHRTLVRAVMRLP